MSKIGIRDRHALVLLAVAVLVAVLTGVPTKAPGQEGVEEVIVLLDLSQSVPESVFKDYLTGIDRLITSMPEGGQREVCLSILGITEDSYGRPTRLAHKCLPIEKSPFKVKPKEVKQALREEWGGQKSNLRADRLKTDVLGAIAFAKDDFLGNTTKRTLILFSDMRHDANDIDLDSPHVVSPNALAQVRQRGFLVNLKGISVCAVGVHTYRARHAKIYHESLIRFWESYFEESGTTLLGLLTRVPETLRYDNVEAVCRKPGT